MKIVVTGTRGIPDIQGGVETHCQELYPRLAAAGHDVTVICRTPYVGPGAPAEYKGVKLVSIDTPRRKSLEAIVHTLRAVIAARRMHPDILHIHAVGPGLLTPLARLAGLRVVTTNHGPDYERSKWGRLARAVLRAGERAAARYSNAVISISEDIRQRLLSRYGRSSTLIYNGVNAVNPAEATDYPVSLGLTPGRYIVALGRFVREKGFHDLVEAFGRSGLAARGWKLVLAGDADHPGEYSEGLKRRARETGAVLTGFIRGERLHRLMSHAAIFVLPSYHEGLPIALLEALSYGLDVVVSDIRANRLPALAADDFFAVGDVDALADALAAKAARAPRRRAYDLAEYNWDTIAQRTEKVYRDVLDNTKN